MKQKLEWIYKFIILIATAISLYLNFKAFTIQGSIIYYTVQSNLICFIFYFIIFILKILGKLKKNNLYYILKGMATMAITITMIVYQFIIVSNSDPYVGNELAGAFAHLIVPILIISDYIIFGEKGNLKKNYPFIWSFSLIFYIVFDIIYVLLGGRFANGDLYPYFYMNVEELGFIRVAFNCIMIYIFFIGYGTIIQTLDNKIGKK